MVQSLLCKRSAILHFIVQTRPKSQRGINVGEARFAPLLFFRFKLYNIVKVLFQKLYRRTAATIHHCCTVFQSNEQLQHCRCHTNQPCNCLVQSARAHSNSGDAYMHIYLYLANWVRALRICLEFFPGIWELGAGIWDLGSM